MSDVINTRLILLWFVIFHALYIFVNRCFFRFMHQKMPYIWILFGQATNKPTLFFSFVNVGHLCAAVFHRKVFYFDWYSAINGNTIAATHLCTFFHENWWICIFPHQLNKKHTHARKVENSFISHKQPAIYDRFFWCNPKNYQSEINAMMCKRVSVIKSSVHIEPRFIILSACVRAFFLWERERERESLFSSNWMKNSSEKRNLKKKTWTSLPIWLNNFRMQNIFESVFPTKISILSFICYWMCLLRF